MNHDPSTSLRASYTPNMAKLDKPEDIIADTFAEYEGPLPQNREQWRTLTERLARIAAAQIGDDEQSPSDARRIAVEMLRLISGDTDRTFSLRAVLYGRLLQIEDRSLAQIGEAYGLGRAAISHVYRQIKALHPGLSNPADKDESYCEAAAERRNGKRKLRDGSDRRHTGTLSKFFNHQP